jgi:AbrB family looped-hinge helix DNA binding protein
MAIEIIKMSSKGQVVIPQDIRQHINADEGSLFAVMSNKDVVILKKIETPSKEKLMAELESIAKEGKIRLQKKGIKEEDIPKIVEKSRKR